MPSWELQLGKFVHIDLDNMLVFELVKVAVMMHIKQAKKSNVFGFPLLTRKIHLRCMQLSTTGE